MSAREDKDTRAPTITTHRARANLRQILAMFGTPSLQLDDPPDNFVADQMGKSIKWVRVSPPSKGNTIYEKETD